eukprot:365864-Chlamydomonas_euryale.AAC.7
MPATDLDRRRLQERVRATQPFCPALSHAALPCIGPHAALPCIGVQAALPCIGVHSKAQLSHLMREKLPEQRLSQQRQPQSQQTIMTCQRLHHGQRKAASWPLLGGVNSPNHRLVIWGTARRCSGRQNHTIEKFLPEKPIQGSAVVCCYKYNRQASLLKLQARTNVHLASAQHTSQ